MSSPAGVEVSVIIPTYDRPAGLSACLEALSAQSFPLDRFEVIIADDGSTPGCEPIADRFSVQLHLKLCRQSNQGPAAARNRASGLASGEFLAFTDDDCCPGPQWIENLHLALRQNPGALVGGRTLNASPEIPCAAASQCIHDLVYAYYNRRPEEPRFFASNNIALPAEDFRALGGFNCNFRNSEDRDFCDRWLHSGRRLVYAPNAVVLHAQRTTFLDFWRQHCGYGRGAYRFQLERRRRNSQARIIEGSFYRHVLCSVPTILRRSPHPLRLLFLLACWQAANLKGYCLEWFALAAPARAKEKHSQ